MAPTMYEECTKASLSLSRLGVLLNTFYRGGEYFELLSRKLHDLVGVVIIVVH